MNNQDKNNSPDIPSDPIKKNCIVMTNVFLHIF
jgi:hypothetical protein